MDNGTMLIRISHYVFYILIQTFFIIIKRHYHLEFKQPPIVDAFSIPLRNIVDIEINALVMFAQTLVF